MDDRTAARNARATRIAALHRKAVSKFRDSFFAYRLMEGRIEGLDTRAPTYTEAAALMRRAIRSMEHWNKRSSQLARAEIRTVLGNLTH